MSFYFGIYWCYSFSSPCFTYSSARAFPIHGQQDKPDQNPSQYCLTQLIPPGKKNWSQDHFIGNGSTNSPEDLVAHRSHNHDHLIEKPCHLVTSERKKIHVKRVNFPN